MAKELTNVEVIHLIQELKQMEKAEEPKCCRSKIFRQIPKEFIVTVCLGCGKRYESSDCGCPAGSAENLRNEDEIAKILTARTVGNFEELISEFADNLEDAKKKWRGKYSIEPEVVEKEVYQIVESTRGFEMNMAYPQYVENYSQEDVISINTWIQLQRFALGRLNDKTFGPTIEVRHHMVQIVNGFIPYNMRITSRVSKTE